MHPPHEDVQHSKRLETQVKVSMKYLGVFKEKWSQSKDSKKDNESVAEMEEPDEIMLMQQHCGGNTYPVFKGLLYRNSWLLKLD